MRPPSSSPLCAISMACGAISESSVLRLLPPPSASNFAPGALALPADLARRRLGRIPHRDARLVDLRAPQARHFDHVRTKQWSQIIMERRGHVVAGGIDEMILHNARLAGDRLQRDQRIVDRIIADAADRHRPVARARKRILHRLLADLARLTLVDLADAADERALQIAECIAAHALHAELGLHLLA